MLEAREAAHVHVTISVVGRGQHPTGAVKEVCELRLQDGPLLWDLKVLVIRADGGNILIV